MIVIDAPGKSTAPPFLVNSHCPSSLNLLDIRGWKVRSASTNPSGAGMIPLDLSGKLALVTGVGDNVGFAWYIAKALQAAGARLVFACHPRLVNIVESILKSDRPDDVESRVLPFGRGTLKPEKVLACDVSYDS